MGVIMRIPVSDAVVEFESSPQHLRMEFANDLRTLHCAAGSPSLRMLATTASARVNSSALSGRAVSISAQRISDWKSGRNIPATFDALHPVLMVLFQRVRRRQAPVDRRLLDMRAWKVSWGRAHTHMLRTRVKASERPRDARSDEVIDAQRAVLSGATRRSSGLLAIINMSDSTELLSIMIRGQAAVDAAVWASMKRHGALLYRAEQLATALNHIDISGRSPMTTDALVVDFLRASSNALEDTGNSIPADSINPTP